MEKQEEISQWASKVIGRSSVGENNEAKYGAHLALGPADNGQHGGYGWHSNSYQNEWIELAFDKAVIPTSFELFVTNGYYPSKIFGRSPTQELIDVYNNPQAVASKGQAVGFKVDLKKVQTPMKQFRFEFPDTSSSRYYVRFWAVTLNGISILSQEIQLVRRDIQALQHAIAANDSINQIKGERDRAVQENADLQAQLAASQAEVQDIKVQLVASKAAKSQFEQVNTALQADCDNTKAQLIALQAAKSQLEQDAKLQIQSLTGERDAAVQGMAALTAQLESSQAKLNDLQHKLDQQSVQGIVTNISNATVQDVLTLAAYQHVDVSSVHVDKLAVAHILAFDSFDDYFEDSEAEPSNYEGLLKLYATIKTAKDSQQLASNVPVSVWINKQPRHQDESIAKKMDEAATRFDEKGYTESMLRYLEPRSVANHLGIKPTLLTSLKKELIASQEAVHLVPMHAN